MHFTLRKKLTLSFSTAFCLLIAAFGLIVLHTTDTRHRQQGHAHCQQIVQANIALVDHYFAQLRNIAYTLTNDADIMTAVYYRENHPQVDYAIELYNQRKVTDRMKNLEVLTGIQNALIIGSNGEYYYFYGASPIRDYNFNHQAWFREHAHPENVTFTNYHDVDYLLTGNAGQSVSMLAPIYNTRRYSHGSSAYLLCDFRLDPILIEASDNEDMMIALYAGTQPVYSPQEMRLAPVQQQELSAGLASDAGYFLISPCGENDVEYLVVSEVSQTSGWSIVGIMSLSNLDSLRTTNTAFTILVMLLAFLLALMLSHLISRSFLRPINQLIEKFGMIGRGGEKPVFENTNSVEIDQIVVTARQMLERIDQLTQSVVEEQQALAKAQCRILQHQINPHFINNVLQSIKALALCGRGEDASQMATLLGKLMAYSVYHPYEMIPIKDEFTYCLNYVALQNVRHEHQIKCQVDLPAALENFKIPKLIVQPLVENAIEHGFSTESDGTILISANREEEDIFLTVSNSGKPIPPGEVEALNQMLRQGNAESESYSIGLLNVLGRLRSCFGMDVDLRVLSRLGMNTCVVISIPWKEEKPDDKSDNRG